MKKSAFLVLAGALSFASVAQAALSPFHQRNKEIAAILDHPEVQALVESKSGEIDAVIFQGYWRGGPRFVVRAGECEAGVLVMYNDTPDPIPGPIQFDIYVDKEMTCKAVPTK